MLRRHSLVIAAAAVSCLALLPVTSAQAAVGAPWTTPRPGFTYSPVRFQRPARESTPPRGHIPGESVAACERSSSATRARAGAKTGTACPPSRSSVPRSPPGSGQVTRASHGPPTWPTCCTGTPLYTGTRVPATCELASNGTISMSNSEKASYIRKLADDFTVIFEVGFKDPVSPRSYRQKRGSSTSARISKPGHRWSPWRPGRAESPASAGRTARSGPS